MVSDGPVFVDFGKEFEFGELRDFLFVREEFLDKLRVGSKSRAKIQIMKK